MPIVEPGTPEVLRAAETATLLLHQLAGLPHLEARLRQAVRKILAADRLRMTIEVSEKGQGLRLAIIPAPDGKEERP